MRTFYIVWFGQLISTLGSGLTGFALGVWIYDQTNSVTQFAINSFAYLITSLLISPVAGALVDRWNRRWILILCDTGAGLSTLVAWILFTTGNLDIWHIYVITVFNAAFTSFQWAAHSAAITMLVPQDQLGRAGGMGQIGDSISRLVTPALAGVLYLVYGLGFVIAIDFFTFAFAVLTLMVIHIPEPERAEESKESQGSFIREITFGFRFIVERKGLLYYMLVLTAINFAFSFTNPLLFPLMLELGNAQQVGFISSFVGLGMLLGTLVMSAWGGPKNNRRVFVIIAADFWSGLCLIASGIIPSLRYIGIANFLMMVVFPIRVGNSRAIWQIKIPPDLQGRVLSARRMIALALTPIATLLAGPLVDNVFQPMMSEGGKLAGSLGKIIGVGPGRGTALAFILAGLVIIVSSGVALANPSIRRLEIEIPDVIIKERDQEE